MHWTPQFLRIFSGRSACVNPDVRVRCSAVSVDFISLASLYKVCRNSGKVVWTQQEIPCYIHSQQVGGVDDASHTHSLCCQENQVISSVELIRHFLPLPTHGCSISCLNNAEDLLVLWTRLCRKPPTVLCMCERQTAGKLHSQFSIFYPQVMSENGFCNGT